MKLKLKDYFYIVLGILLGYFYTECSHYFVLAGMSKSLARLLLVVVYLLVFLLIFALIKPKQTLQLSKTLSLWLTVAAALIIFIEDICLKHYALSKIVIGTIIILGTTLIGPFLVGYTYDFLKSKLTKKAKPKGKKRK